MDYYQFLAQQQNLAAKQNSDNDLISLSVNNANNNLNNNNAMILPVNNSPIEPSSNLSLEDILERQKKIKEMIEKKKEESHNSLPAFAVQQQQQQQQLAPPDVNNQAAKIENFIQAIERKLESLESAVTTLSQDFQNFSYHQTNYNNEFLRAISHLSNDISAAKNTVAQVSTVSTLSKSSSFSISPAFAEHIKNGPSQEDLDAELAKKLQEEFDRLAVNNRPAVANNPPPPLNVSNIYPSSNANQLFPVSAANNIYGSPSPAVSPVSPPSNPAVSAERGECPFCNISLPQKDLQAHVESHLANNENPPPANNSLWNKIFGKSNTTPTAPKPPAPQQPPKPQNMAPVPYVYGRPPPAIGYPPNAYPVNQGSMIYRPQPVPGAMPPNMLPPNAMPYPQQPQVIYVNPDGTPAYPK